MDVPARTGEPGRESAGEFLRSARTEISIWVRRPLSDPEWELVVAMLGLGGRADRAQLSRRLGVSESRIAALAGGLPARLVTAADIGAHRVWALRWPESVPTPDEPSREQRAAFRRARDRGRTRRPDATSRAWRIEASLEAARRLLDQGRFAEVGRLVRVQELGAREVLAAVPPKERPRLRARLALFHAEWAMQRGDTGRTRAALARAHAAVSDGCPEWSWDAWRLEAVAARMEGRIPEAVRCWDAVETLLTAAAPDERRRLQRWMFASTVVVHLLAGDTDRADIAARRAMDLEDGFRIESSLETSMVAARIRMTEGQISAASSLLGSVRNHVTQAPRWIRGWLERYEADLLVTAGNGVVAAWPLLEAAWWANEGYGFQRDEVLCRMACLPDLDGLLAGAADGLARSVALHVGARHRKRWRRFFEDCRVCRNAHWGARIAHALEGSGAWAPDPWNAGRTQRGSP